jgi:hypothetical protein
MITRIWHGWTTPGNADAYEALLLSEIRPGIVARGIAGVTGPQVLRRDLDGEVEFVTVMTFPDWSAVEAFAGPQPLDAVVPAAARRLLRQFDTRPQHYRTLAA